MKVRDHLRPTSHCHWSSTEPRLDLAWTKVKNRPTDEKAVRKQGAGVNLDMDLSYAT